jgi:YesN/AraC family two-component response regulator
MARPRTAVLLIDDQPFFHVWIAESLEGLYEVVAARDSTVAFAALKTKAFAAIILDVVLEHENGLDLVPKLRLLSHAPIVVLTAYEEYAMRAANLKVDGYLKKTFSQQELWDALGRVVPVDPIDHAKSFMDDHYPEDLNALDVAEHVGISEGYLRTEFHKEHGVTPMQYLRFVRLQHGCQLLAETDIQITNIAKMVGYANPERFRRTFLRSFQVSPSEYRSYRVANKNDGSIVENAD